MSKIKLTGDSSGYVEISAPSAAGNNTLELPASGSKIVVSDGSDNINVAGIITATNYDGKVNNLTYPTAGPLSNRNLIINGAMTVAQRGTSTSISASSTGFAADRFKLANVTEAVVTLSRETTGNPDGFNYWSKVLVTTADTSIASNQYFTYSQLIEGYNTSQLNYGTANAKNVTVSFYFKTNKIGTYCMIHRNNVANRNYLYEFTPSAVDTWERIEYTIPGDTSGVWDIASAIGWRFELTLSNGTAYQSSTTEQWFSGQYYHSTPNQVNFLDAVNNYIGITGVQVEIGENATEFEHRSYGQELALCQRYFERIGGSRYAAIGVGKHRTTSESYFNVVFQVEKRAVPSVSWTGTIITTDRYIYDQTVTSLNQSEPSRYGFHGAFLHSAVGAEHRPIFILGPPTGTFGYMDFSAEL